LNGRVDDLLRALIEVPVGRSRSGERNVVTAWIDTAFNGQFVFPRQLIEQLRLEQLAATEAILADGSKVTLESYVCYTEWFSTVVATQVIANDGKMPLLGTELLANRVLLIDYANRRVSLD
jgi:clan AA aspartic protease